MWMATAAIDATVVLLIVGAIWLIARRRAVPQVGIWLFLLVLLKLVIPMPVAAPDAMARWTPSAIVARTFFETPKLASRSTRIPASDYVGAVPDSDRPHHGSIPVASELSAVESTGTGLGIELPDEDLKRPSFSQRFRLRLAQF